MVVNFPVSCDICSCTIRLRYQASEVLCPIKFQCPECKSEISGYLQTVWREEKVINEVLPWYYDFRLNNASQTSINTCKYVLEISPDLTTNKIAIDSNDMANYISTPFMRQAFNLNGIINQNTRFYSFLKIWENEWNKLKILVDLCYNEKYDILLSCVSKKYESLPVDVNCVMVVHQELIKFCTKILPRNTLKEYTKLGEKLIRITTKYPNLFDEFTRIYDYEYTKQIERKLLQLIKTFLDIYPKFLPVFNTLRVSEYRELGISTMSFEDVKSFYQDAYELILYNLPRIVALNNIYCRNDINKFIDNTKPFENKINMYRSKVNIYKELISKHDDFSWLISSAIENHIRNSIGHFNYEENLTEQTILFVDDHRGSSKTETKYLIEIARDCVYMFYTLMNLLELNYNLLKIQTIIK